MGKPVNDSGMWCPLARGWCSKTCHTCEMWMPLEVSAKGVARDEWACALKWPAITGAVANAKLHGMGAAHEQLRNQFAAFKDSILALVGAMGVASRQIERTLPPQPLTEAKNAANKPG